MKVTGGCHCGAVRFEIDVPQEIEVLECNCSICAMTGFVHLIVPGADFRLLAGQEALTNYQFGTRTAHHLFCSHCGTKSFYRPRSHPEDYSVNFNCVDQSGFTKITRTPFDGQNWEQNIHAIR